MSKALITGGEAGFREYLNSDAMIERLNDVAGQYVTPKELVKSAMTSIIKTPKLLDCTKQSWAIALMQAAVIGLKIGPPFNHACLVPYKDSKNNVINCTFQPMYQGLIYLAMDSGIVTDVSAKTVYDCDDFNFDEGSEPFVHHKWNVRDIEKRTNENIIAFYSVIWTKLGRWPLIKVMPKKEVDAIRARAKNQDGYSPWNTDYPDMGQKTVYKKNQKYAPIGQTRRLVEALSYDDAAQLGEQPKEQELVQIENGKEPDKDDKLLENMNKDDLPE